MRLVSPGSAISTSSARRRVLRPAGGLLCVLLLGLAGCGPKEAPPPPAPPAVTVNLPVRKTVPVYADYVGQVDSPQTVELRARVEGFLKEIHFQEGSEVEQGALMFGIDPDQYQVALEKAQAQWLSAEAALAQAKNVKDIEVDRANVARDEAALVNAQQVARDAKLAVEAKAMARSQLDSAEAGLKEAEAVLVASRAKLAQSEADYQTRVAQAEAGLALAKNAVTEAGLNLGYTKIRSPVKGRVGLAYSKIGALVGHGDPTLLATVSLVDPVYVNFTVSESEVFEMRRLADAKKQGPIVDGQLPVRMVLQDGHLYQSAGVPLEGRINFADRALDAGTGTLNMRAVFPNPDHFLRPGMYAKVRMALTERPDALLVSERAIGGDQGGPFLLVVDGENKVEHRSVELGPKLEGLIVIEKGLKADERVVVNGLQRARPGLVVAPTLAAAAAPPATAAPRTAAGAEAAAAPPRPAQR